MQQKSSGGMTTKRLIALIALAVLAVAVIVFAVREIRLYGDVQVEQSRTPTPVPGYGNVMQVTIDPSLPTPVPVLRSGAQGEAVWQLQERLQALGYLTGSLNMRKTASKSAEVIAKIPQGATITVLMEADDWWRVQYKNSTGWCAAEFLTKQENADNQARRSIRIVDSAGNVFEPVGDFTVKVANADVGDS